MFLKRKQHHEPTKYLLEFTLVLNTSMFTKDIVCIISEKFPRYAISYEPLLSFLSFKCKYLFEGIFASSVATRAVFKSFTLI